MSQEHHFLRKQENWKDLYFYRKTEVLYQLTFRFTKRFLRGGDRTIDQMVQAARSGKQNIIEGFSAGVTSTETEIKLLNVARASIQELQEDFKDYLTARNLPLWSAQHERFQTMIAFTRKNNDIEDYAKYLKNMNHEELANLGYTLCRQVDVLMTGFLKEFEQFFIEEGGIRERMTAARLGRRQTQNETIEAQAHEIQDLRNTIASLQATLAQQQVTIAEQTTHITSLETENAKWRTWWSENKHHFPNSDTASQQEQTHQQD